MTAPEIISLDRAALDRIARRLCPLRQRGLPCGWCERLPPLEQYTPIPDDKVHLTPSQRRPLRRDLERLIERWRR